tara:strand:+ start:149237 stop:149419 length:183 start_codon:yes stop_codon:yes gene_type:complete
VCQQQGFKIETAFQYFPAGGPAVDGDPHQCGDRLGLGREAQQAAQCHKAQSKTKIHVSSP